MLDMTPIPMIVNGRKAYWNSGPCPVSYESACGLAGVDPATQPTVAYAYADGRGGTLTPHVGVGAERGMIWNITHTSNS